MTFLAPENLRKVAYWTVFISALITYGLTVEPSVSFWDSGEYISTSAKLQVGHPPGAPRSEEGRPDGHRAGLRAVR